MLHVSPFMTMAMRYHVRLGEPGEHLRVGISVTGEDGLLFSAGMSLRRRPLTRAELGRSLREHPLLSHRVSASIYTEAFKLWRKGAPVHGHPRPGGPKTGTDSLAAGGCALRPPRGEGQTAPTDTGPAGAARSAIQGLIPNPGYASVRPRMNAAVLV